MPRGRGRHVGQDHVRPPVQRRPDRVVGALVEEVELASAGPGDRLDRLQVDAEHPAHGRPLRAPSAFTRATATCTQPPGAQPRSTTRAPGFRSPKRSSISMSLKAARLR